MDHPNLSLGISSGSDSGSPMSESPTSPHGQALLRPIPIAFSYSPTNLSAGHDDIPTNTVNVGDDEVTDDSSGDDVPTNTVDSEDDDFPGFRSFPANPAAQTNVNSLILGSFTNPGENQADVFTVEDNDRICCLGAGRVGVLCTMVLAYYWPEKKFVVLDSSPSKIEDLNNRNMPFSEPGMEDLLEACLDVGNLIFSSDIPAELDNCYMVFVAVDIPLTVSPKELKGKFNITRWEEAINLVSESIGRVGGSRYMVVKSTLPVDYKGDIHDLLRNYRYSDALQVVTNPEFFSEGTAMADLLHLHRVVMGSVWQANLGPLSDLYMRVVDNDGGKIQQITSESSVELGKLMTNALLAARLTVVNIASTMCEKVGTKYDDVRSTMTCHPRVGESFLDARPGYGGLGLTKDIACLSYLCGYMGLPSEKKILQRVD